MKAVPKMYTSAKKIYRLVIAVSAAVVLCAVFLFAKSRYQNNDFGKLFGTKAVLAQQKISSMQLLFETCAAVSKSDAVFMEAIVFPEIMRYSSLKDGIEAESLRTLYVQFGKEYADFSIGIFQMKPSFAEEVEAKAMKLLPASVNNELLLQYDTGDDEEIRRQRVERLQDEEWQMVYLTAFTCICNELLKDREFNNELEKLQWYATVYNAGFDRTDAYISKKISQENFYLQQQMPGKKFRYAAIAGWYFQLKHS